MAIAPQFIAWSRDDDPVLISWIPDAEALFRVSGPMLRWPLTQDQLDDMRAAPGRTSWAVVEAGRPLAHGNLTREEDHGRLDRIVVDPARRGQGVGRLLVEGLVGEAVSARLGRLDLNVVEGNDAAERLYLSVGFVRNPEPVRPGVFSMTLTLPGR